MTREERGTWALRNQKGYAATYAPEVSRRLSYRHRSPGGSQLITLVYQFRRIGGGYGIATICGGLAQGDAVLVRVD